jgi:intein-encoded DNA endonuclease-like protein
MRPWIESSKSPITYAIKENIRRHEAAKIKPQNINLHKATTNPTRGIKVMSSRTSTRPNNSISRT